VQGPFLGLQKASKKLGDGQRIKDFCDSTPGLVMDVSFGWKENVSEGMYHDYVWVCKGYFAMQNLGW